jgi:DNA-binding NarL/FixJ family response regulator
MISILLVDDHTYIRRGLCSLIEATADMEVVATASNGIEGVAKARLYQPNVAVMDISMPFMDGLEAIRQVRSLCPHTRVLTLSIYDNPAYIEGALQAGVRGYILKESIGEELLEAIRVLHGGERYFSPRVASHIFPSAENGSSMGPAGVNANKPGIPSRL